MPNNHSPRSTGTRTWNPKKKAHCWEDIFICHTKVIKNSDKAPEQSHHAFHQLTLNAQVPRPFLVFDINKYIITVPFYKLSVSPRNTKTTAPVKPLMSSSPSPSAPPKNSNSANEHCSEDSYSGSKSSDETVTTRL